ncbi:MAG: FtsQ-type POTRA domain-containing protein [Gordonia sp. (in: high G+C Gram-positive bacteria)]
MTGSLAIDPDDARRRGRRRLWRLVLAVLLVAVLGGLAAAAYYSPLMSVRSVEVDGTRAVPQDEVLAVAAVPQGRPLLQVDTGAIADRVVRIRGVETARVDRSYPSTVSITVTERKPLAVVERSGKFGVMDRFGVVYAEFSSMDELRKDPRSGRTFAALPRLEVPTPGPKDPTTHAVLSVIAALPQWLASQTATVTASTPSDIALHLKSGRTVIWGDDERSADKAEAAAALLKRFDAKKINVASPDFPAVGG